MERIGLVLVLIVAGLLAGCATPLQQCLLQANQDVRDIQRELDTRRGNVQRGTRIERIVVPEMVTEMCSGPQGQIYPCQRWSQETREIFHPINRDLERERIALLERQLEREQRRALEASAQCHATYPAQ